MGSSVYHRELSASCPDGWQVVPLAEVAFFQEGPGILAKDFCDHGVPLIRLKGVEGDFVTLDGCNYLDPEKVAAKWSHFQLNRGDLVISTSASFGRVSEVTEDAEGAIPYTGLIRFRPSSPGLDRSYLRAFLSSAAFMQQVEAMASGSVIRHFGPTHLKQMVLFLPPLEEQRAIGQISDLFADRLRLLRQTNATLEAIAQALFKSWFVDFDPVHAKAEGREPKGMDAATAALFPSEFEDSELGPIPKGWRVEQVGKLVSCLGGATPSTKDESFWLEGIHHWATPKDLSGLASPVLIDTNRKITDAGLSKISSGLLPVGTLLLSSRAPIGYLAIAAMQTAINQGFIAMPPGGELSPLFLLCWCKENMDLIQQSANGSTFMEISKKAFRPLPICVPTAEIHAAFDQLASPIIDKIKANEYHRHSLTELRDTLLPRLISGKLRLPEAEVAAAEDFPA